MTPPTAPQAVALPPSAPGTEAAPVSLERILVALDASDHANRALQEAVRLAGTADGTITGIHAYAAQLHDRRFRQMEGALPERYHVEGEMEHQREVHDDLITRGLGIISDSYHDDAQKTCDGARIAYRRLSPEGKNYSRIVDAARPADFDVLTLGAVGLGAVPGSPVGTVCERVVRRCPIDVLVIRDPARAIGDGPIVVGIDGSEKSYGALKTAIDIGRRLSAEVHAVAAYDPYYHYVAFNKISGVLSEEAGEVFRFKEQEKLHEELIDDGIAKIYQSHLDVARTIAEDEDVDLACTLLDGKPYRAIQSYLEKVRASLLVVGKTGVHADAELDIGGNAENLLRTAPCHVWLGQVGHEPSLNVIAEETMTWSVDAEAYLEKAPSFVRDMARKAVQRFAHDRGHTFVTRDLVEQVAMQMMSGNAEAVEVRWSPEASALAEGAGDPSRVETVRLRSEKRARMEGSTLVTPEHVRPFIGDQQPSLPWSAAALARLARVPELIRETCGARIEERARERTAPEVTLEIAEETLADIRRTMCPVSAEPEGGGSDTGAEQG